MIWILLLPLVSFLALLLNLTKSNFINLVQGAALR